MATHCGRNSCVHYSHASPTYKTGKCPVTGCGCSLYVECDCGSILYHDTSDSSRLSGGKQNAQR
jgi:hypothetical protein